MGQRDLSNPKQYVMRFLSMWTAHSCCSFHTPLTVKNSTPCKLWTFMHIAVLCSLVQVDFAHILQGCFTGIGAIIWLLQWQGSNPEEYGKTKSHKSTKNYILIDSGFMRFVYAYSSRLLHWHWGNMIAPVPEETLKHLGKNHRYKSLYIT